jgi:hypothetical protein
MLIVSIEESAFGIQKKTKNCWDYGRILPELRPILD